MCEKSEKKRKDRALYEMAEQCAEEDNHYDEGLRI
jgi:hypothetical protein